MTSTSRRTFIKSAAASAAGLSVAGIVGCGVLGGARPSGTHVKAIVIGSGFGGSITALRLGEAGVQTLVLERGQRWGRSASGRIFASEAFPDRRAIWRDDFVRFPGVLPLPVESYLGVMERTVSRNENMDVYAGACLGGGSVVYTAVSIEPEREFFERIYGNRINFSEMREKWYPRARAGLGVTDMPDDVYNSYSYRHSRQWDEIARAAGYSTTVLGSTFDWDVIRAEDNGDSQRSATIGESNFGNSNGAKKDLTRNYIPAAEATGNVRFATQQNVAGITRLPNGRYELQVELLAVNGDVVERYELTCAYLFIGAGTVGTNKLLVKARDTRTLPDLSELVGTGWGNNGNTIAARSFSNLQGFRQGAGSRSSIRDNGDGSTFAIRAESWHNAIPFETLVAQDLGLSYDDTYRGVWNYNVLTGQVELDWPDAANEAQRLSHLHVSEKLADAGNSELGVPLFMPAVRTGFCAHPLGGATIGKATDLYGRAVGYENLYVVDGALMDGNNGCANPSLTIAALAERNIDTVLREDFS